MKLVQVAIAIGALLDFAIAKGYDSRGAAGGLQIRKIRPGGGAEIKFSDSVNTNFDSVERARFKPYSFEYSVSDVEGNTHYRSEEGDENGSVRGTYGYTDVQGLYRIVEYVADEKGFRANIRTNEPGVGGKQSPAGVVLIAEEPPAGIQDRSSSAGDGTSGAGGGGSYRGRADGDRGDYKGGVDRGRGAYRGGVDRGRGDYEGGVDRGRGDYKGGVDRGRGDYRGGVDRGRGDYRGGVDRGRGDYKGGIDRGREDYRGGVDRGREDYRGGVDRGRGDYKGGVDRGRGDYRDGARGNRQDYKGGSGGGRESFINYAGDAGDGEADGYGSGTRRGDSGGFRGKAVGSADVRRGKSGYRTGN